MSWLAYLWTWGWLERDTRVRRGRVIGVQRVEMPGTQRDLCLKRKGDVKGYDCVEEGTQAKLLFLSRKSNEYHNRYHGSI
jgi:hypothetical protein